MLVTNGAQAVPRVQVFDDYVIRSRAFADERELQQVAAAAGAAPALTLVGPDQIRMPRYQPLTPLILAATAERRQELAFAVLACIERLHAAGVCHRDAHRDNFVMDGDRALLVDFELACRSEPAKPCFDLIGPASGIEPHWRHVWLGMKEGVWWDSPSERVRELWQDFGHLAEVRAARAARPPNPE